MTLLNDRKASPEHRHALRRERRRWQRVALELPGRFLDASSEEHPLMTQNISCGGGSFATRTRPDIGSNIVIYIDELARLSARVTRHTSTGFVAEFSIPDHKRERLADKLVWLVNYQSLGLSEERQAERFPASGPAVVIRDDGTKIQCRAMDISLTGACFEAESNPPFIGEIVQAGNLRAEVVRRERRVFAVRFLAAEQADPAANELAQLGERFRKRMAGM